MVDFLEFDLPSFVVVYRFASWTLMCSLMWGPIAGVITAVSAHRLEYQWEALGLRGTGLSALFLLP